MLVIRSFYNIFINTVRDSIYNKQRRKEFTMCAIEEFEKAIDNLEKYVQLDNVLNSTKMTPFWIKDRNFRFLRVNQAICNLMYPGAKPEDLYGKTDWEYMASIGSSEEVVNYVKNCCVYSDKYTLKSKRTGEKFYEKASNTKGETFWLLTTKEKIPPETDERKAFGVYGTAVVFPLADKIIAENLQKLEKLSDNVYRIIE